jgi:hypothetical protein
VFFKQGQNLQSNRSQEKEKSYRVMSLQSLSNQTYKWNNSGHQQNFD